MSKASLLNHLNTIVKQRLEEDIQSVDLDHNDQMPTLEIDELWEALTKMYRTKNVISWETMFVATFQGKSSDFESKNMTSRDIKELKKDAISKFYKKKRGKKKIIELSVILDQCFVKLFTKYFSYVVLCCFLLYFFFTFSCQVISMLLMNMKSQNSLTMNI